MTFASGRLCYRHVDILNPTKKERMTEIPFSKVAGFFPGWESSNDMVFVFGYNYDEAKGPTCPFSVRAYQALEKAGDLGYRFATIPKPNPASPNYQQQLAVVSKIKSDMGVTSFPHVWIRDPDTNQFKYIGQSSELLKQLS